MAKIRVTDEWWTTPTESDNGKLIIVTGRGAVEPWRSTGKFRYRMEITWRYDSGADGMPDTPTAELMEQVTDALTSSFNADPVAVVTGVYTGDGERNIVIYTLSLPIFQKKLNDILEPFPALPLEFEAALDEEWAEYDEMRDKTEILDDGQ